MKENEFRNESEFRFEPGGRGALVIDDNEGRQAEMKFEKQERNLIVHDLHISDKLKTHGAGPALVEKIVNYAREENLAVVPLCPYVQAQFNKHPDRYADIWNRHYAL